MSYKMMFLGLLAGGVALAAEPNPPQPEAQPPSPAEAQPESPGAPKTKGADQAQAKKTTEGVIDPKADAILHRMDDSMTKLKTFRVETKTVDEKITKDGQKIQAVQMSDITVKRPGQMRVDRVGPNGHATFRDDGKHFALYNKDKNVYAVAAAPGNLDAAVDQARSRLGIDAPGADLIVSDPYATLTDGLKVGRYIGLEPLDGTMAHHIALSKDDVDLQIWIKDGPDALPLRYVVTSKDMPSHPQFTIELHDWQTNATVPDGAFAFSPPAGATRIQFGAREKAER
jgi:hypothetical protein